MGPYVSTIACDMIGSVNGGTIAGASWIIRCGRWVKKGKIEREILYSNSGLVDGRTNNLCTSHA